MMSLVICNGVCMAILLGFQSSKSSFMLLCNIFGNGFSIALYFLFQYFPSVDCELSFIDSLLFGYFSKC